MKPTQAALAANVNYGTGRKWKKTLNIPVCKLDEVHKTHLINFLMKILQ